MGVPVRLSESVSRKTCKEVTFQVDCNRVSVPRMTRFSPSSCASTWVRSHSAPTSFAGAVPETIFSGIHLIAGTSVFSAKSNAWSFFGIMSVIFVSWLVNNLPVTRPSVGTMETSTTPPPGRCHFLASRMLKLPSSTRSLSCTYQRPSLYLSPKGKKGQVDRSGRIN